MSNSGLPSDEERRSAQNMLPVHTLEDLSRADLGSARVVRMVVNDELAERAEELQARGLVPGAGAGEGNSPFHTERQEHTYRHEE